MLGTSEKIELEKLWAQYTKAIGNSSTIIFVFLLIKWIYTGIALDSKILLFIFLLITINIGSYIRNANSGKKGINKLIVNLYELSMIYIVFVKGLYPLIFKWSQFDTTFAILYRFAIVFFALLFAITHFSNHNSITRKQQQIRGF